MNQRSYASEGFLCLHKPPGISSFKCIPWLRKLTGIKKIGHAGTLDPFASGLLILGIGKSYTSQLDLIQSLPKTYRIRCRLGLKTDTADCYGAVIHEDKNKGAYKEADIENRILNLPGTILQQPPIFSAKKVNGKRAYQLARHGEVPELKPKEVTIYSSELILYHYPYIDFEVRCSKGTYARQIVVDLAAQLDTVAYTLCLIRSEIGPFSLGKSVLYHQLSTSVIAQNIIKQQLNYAK